jgi:hypothetical protein
MNGLLGMAEHLMEDGVEGEVSTPALEHAGVWSPRFGPPLWLCYCIRTRAMPRLANNRHRQSSGGSKRTLHAQGLRERYSGDHPSGTKERGVATPYQPRSGQPVRLLG